MPTNPRNALRGSNDPPSYKMAVVVCVMVVPVIMETAMMTLTTFSAGFHGLGRPWQRGRRLWSMPPNTSRRRPLRRRHLRLSWLSSRSRKPGHGAQSTPPPAGDGLVLGRVGLVRGLRVGEPSYVRRTGPDCLSDDIVGCCPVTGFWVGLTSAVSLRRQWGPLLLAPPPLPPKPRSFTTPLLCCFCWGKESLSLLGFFCPTSCSLRHK